MTDLDPRAYIVERYSGRLPEARERLCGTCWFKDSFHVVGIGFSATIERGCGILPIQSDGADCCYWKKREGEGIV